ncbi:MAG: glutathione binding-like protein, partial [Pseudomonadota bacterium]
VPQISSWGEANRPKALWFAELLNKHLADNEYVCGDAFTVADITAIIAMDFSKPAKIVYPEELENLHAWAARIRARSSYKP